MSQTDWPFLRRIGILMTVVILASVVGFSGLDMSVRNSSQPASTATLLSLWCDLRSFFGFACQESSLVLESAMIHQSSDTERERERELSAPDITTLPTPGPATTTVIQNITRPVETIREVVIRDQVVDTSRFVTKEEYAAQVDAIMRSIESMEGDTTVVNQGGGDGLSDITQESIEDLEDVAAMSKTAGDLFTWDGTAWTNISTSSLGIVGSGSVDSVNGQVGHVTLDTGDISENGNLYFTDARTRAALSSLAPALAYDSATGVFSLASGYTIPLTASTTAWDNGLSAISLLTASSTLWDQAYAWGDHAAAGYLTSFTELDPVFASSTAALITGADLSTWNGTAALVSASSSSWTTAFNIVNASSTYWDQAFASTTALTPAYIRSLFSAGTGLSYAGGQFTNTGVLSLSGQTGDIATSSLHVSTSTYALNLLGFNQNDYLAATTAAATYYPLTNPAGYTTSTGTVTSVAMTVPTGLTVTGSPITASGTLAVALASGYTIPLTASTTEWATAASSSHAAVTLTGQNYLSLSGQQITANAINLGTSHVTGTLDISDRTNLSVTATGLALSGDAVALASGYTIPLSASTTAWNNFFNTPSSRITAGTGLSWSGNTLNASSSADINYWTLSGGNVYRATGNVGIGSTAPSEMLDIHKANGSGHVGLRLVHSGQVEYKIGINDNDDRLYITNNNGNSNIGSSTLGIIIGANGNVGIGTTTPSHLLTVAGDTNQTGALRFNGNSGTAGQVLLSTGSGAPAWVSTSSLGISSGLTTVGPANMQATDFGDFTCNGTSCSLDANSVADNEIDFAQVTLGDFTNDVGYITNIFGQSFYDLMDTPASATANRVLFQNGSAVIDSANFTFNGTLLSAPQLTTTGTTTLATGGGNVGIGTSSPNRKLTVFNTAAEAQQRLSYDGTRYAEFYVDAAGDLNVSAVGKNLRLLDGNLYVCDGGACPSTPVQGYPNTFADQGNAVFGGTIYADGIAPVTCPSGMIPVPPAPEVGMHNGFCVDKYETQNDGSNNAVSVQGGSPWVSITQYDARAQCLRAGKHLITEPEWLAIARSVEDRGWNWQGGTAGTNQMSDGHADNVPPNSLATAADSSPCSGTGQSCDLSTWNSQRRVYQLSNDEYIWDFGGNVWEWVDEVNRDNYPIANSGTAGWQTCSTSGDGICGNTRTTNDQWYRGQTTDTRGFLRGGAWSYGADSGAFTLRLATAPGDSHTLFGFRCAQ